MFLPMVDNLPIVDNWAHAGGFVGGYLMGRLLDPLRPERVDHVVLAVLVLLLSAAAIVASFVLGRPDWV
jgi:membrane associated rhomboid family serine protease